ncbi:MAG: lipid-A-disaccharide synthase [Candidatus Gastranaerophilales bacterium]|nr:lipid-A-disaccharide synthase [Candidatus Gastranaerophilales bacterium]
MKKLFIITGEHSGDMHAATVVKELQETMPDLVIEGVGGKNMEAAGVKIFKDHSKMNVVGLSIKAIFDHFKLGKEIIDYLNNEYKPDLVLLIDYGGFNLQIAKILKKYNFETFYYISPQVWASRKHRVSKIRKYISQLMVIFPFEEKFYKKENITAKYVGHPLVSQLYFGYTKEDFIAQNGLNPNKKIVGVFPGSRKFELQYMMPVYKEAIREIYDHQKKIQFCISQAENMDEKFLNKYIDDLKNEGIDIKLIKGQNHALLACSDALILTSGTVTLEAAMYETPMAVCYKGPLPFYWIYLAIRHISKVSLPNIVASKDIVQEFIQHRAQPELIASEILSLLHNQPKREKMIAELKKIKEKFGEKIASKEVAKTIKEYFNV